MMNWGDSMNTYLLVAISFCMLLTAIFAFGFMFDVLKVAWCIWRGKSHGGWKVFEVFTKCSDWKVIILLGTIICVGVYGFFTASIDIVRSEYESENDFCNLCGTYLLNNDINTSKCYHDLISCNYCDAIVPQEFVYITTDADPESYAKAEAKKAAFEATFKAESSNSPLSQDTINKIYDEAYQNAYSYASKNAICHRCIYSDYRALVDALQERPNAFTEDTLIVDSDVCAWCGNPAPASLCNEFGNAICITCITEALQNEDVAKAIYNYSDSY